MKGGFTSAARGLRPVAAGVSAETRPGCLGDLVDKYLPVCPFAPESLRAVIWNARREGLMKHAHVKHGVGRGRAAVGDRAEWSAEELRRLDQALEEGVPAEELAALLGRSAQAVRNRLHRRRRGK